MSRTKTEPASPMIVDACGASEGTPVSAASGTSRQRALSIRKSCLGGNTCGMPRQGKIDAAKHEAAKQRQGKLPAVSGAAAGSGSLQSLSRRRSRGGSVTFAADEPTPCVAASTASRASSPTNDSNRCKRISTGLKNSPLPAGTSMSKEEWPTLPAAAPQSSAGTPTTSLRVSHRNWQSNCMLLYRHIMSHILEWPTLSVQWLHSCNPRANGEIGQTLLLSTHTSGGAANYLLLMEVSLPSEPIDASGLHYEQRQDYQGFEFGDEDTRKFTITARIPHEGESNRARVYHGNDTLIASKANDGCVYLFDSCKFGPALCISDSESEDSQCASQRSQMATDAELILTGHTTQGWGLEWSPTRDGWLASSGDDGLVCIWDTRASCGKGKSISPLHRLVGSSNRSALQDVAWKRGHDAGEVIVAVGDDGELNMWDLRAGALPVHRQPCNHSCANVLALNPMAPNVFATGGADAGVSVWDFRDLRRPAHRLLYIENEALTSLKWHPQNKAVLAAGTTDRFVRIFDCSLIGAEQSPEEAEEGAPEVIFVHGGHVAGITEIDWNPLGDKFPWVIASASEDNVLQIWQPSVKAFEAEEADFICDEGSMDEELLD